MSLQRIGIIHLNQIGDLLFSLPLLKALRENYPDAVIHSFIKPHLQELLASSPYVDTIIPRREGLLEKWNLLRTIRKNSYNLIITLPRSEESLLITALSGAEVKAGFSHAPWDSCLDIKETIEGHNCWYNNAKLLKRLHLTIKQDNYIGLLSINGTKPDKEIPENYVVISPGASRKRLTKTWGHEKFAELIVRLHERSGLTAVLTGSSDDSTYNETIIQMLKEYKGGKHIDVINLSGKITLTTLCTVIQHARLFVGIDSGAMHIASALDIPVVALFGPTDPFYVGPQNSRSIVVRRDDLECVPCYLKNCAHRECMKKLEVNRVMSACEKLLT